MPLDLNAFPPVVRAKQIRLGEQFGSRDTLAQANQTITAYLAYGASLKGGFIGGDNQRLTDARDLLVEAGVGREAARGDKKVTSRAYTDAVKSAQAARLTARSILTGLHDDFDESADPAAPDTSRVIGTALKQTAIASDEAEPLAKQLDALANTLKLPSVAPTAAGREGPAAVLELTAAAAALRKADQDDAGVRGTPAETQRLDQIDGIIVRLVRRARKEALAVSRATGNPALAEAFKLDKLYQSRAPSSREDDGEEEEGEEPGQDKKNK